MCLTDNDVFQDSQNSVKTETNEYLDVIMFVVTLSLFLVICSSNTLTIIGVCRTPRLRTLANMYVVSLAAVDFLLGLALVPMSLFMLPSTRVTLYYHYIHLCVFINGFNVGMMGNSLIHMTVISIDRYLYIVKPYFYQRVITVHSVVGLIASSWAMALVISSIPYFVFHSNGTACYCDATQLLPRWYMFYSTWSLYFPWAFIILVMYLLVVRTAVNQNRRIKAGHMMPVHSNRTREILSKSSLKSIKFFVTVFGAFFVCVTPIVLCMGIDYIDSVPPWLYRCLIVLALMNSAMNFFILTKQNRQFRSELFKLVSCLYVQISSIDSSFRDWMMTALFCF
ncbi:hypothetical protein Btru_066379 [Bulinus truncatus]|nr:hypothetical protein Btru_066379 [Bulinus truncatus]